MERPGSYIRGTSITRLGLVLAAVFLVMAKPAHASVITFNLTGGTGNVTNIIQAQGNSTLTVTPVSTASASRLSQNSDGIGVNSGFILNLPPFLGGPTFVTSELLDGGLLTDNRTQVDKSGPDESVNFSLVGNKVGPWILDSIDFATNNAGTGSSVEQFSLLVDGVSVGTFTINPSGASGPFPIDLTSLLPASARTGSVFDILPGSGDSDFRISALTFTETPEPTSIAVFGMLATGGAFYGWRRRQQNVAA